MKTALRGFLLVLLLVATASAATVTLDNGDRVTGEIRSVADGRIVLATTRFGEVTIDLADVVRIDGDPDVAARLEAPTAVPAPGEALEAAIEVLAEETAGEDTSPWSAKIELGADFSAGNTDRWGGDIAFSAVRETADDIFSVKASALYAEENGARTVNEQHLAFREDIKFDPWYVFALLSFERDEFEDLDLRVVFAPGVGRILADSDEFKAKVEIGPSLTFEDYRSADSEYTFGLRLGGHAEWRVFDEAKLTEDLQVFPGFKDGLNWRIESETAFENPLSEHLFFKLSIRNDFNTDVAMDVKRWDVKVLASLVYEF